MPHIETNTPTINTHNPILQDAVASTIKADLTATLSQLQLPHLQKKYAHANATLQKFEQSTLLTVEDPNERTTVQFAYNFMIYLHSKQKDRHEGPYFCHPAAVANYATTVFGLDEYEDIIVALLHDVIEDQTVLLASLYDLHIGDPERLFLPREKALLLIIHLFGATVANRIYLLTKPEGVNKSLVSYSEFMAKYGAYLWDINLKSPRDFLIKSADCLNNTQFTPHYEPGLKEYFANKNAQSLPVFIDILEEHRFETVTDIDKKIIIGVLEERLERSRSV